MKFYLYLFLGFLGGIPAGMGMGGGTVTIPLLTILGKVGQKVAQSTNLFSFLPMSAFALKEHKKNGLIEKESVLPTVPSALLFCVVGTVLVKYLPSEFLQKGFGVFLLALSFFSFRAVFTEKKKGK